VILMMYGPLERARPPRLQSRRAPARKNPPAAER
jgi:hypothetical protein